MTGREYYAAYYRRRRDECIKTAEFDEAHGNPASANFYRMRANDYEEAAKAQEK